MTFEGLITIDDFYFTEQFTTDMDHFRIGDTYYVTRYYRQDDKVCIHFATETGVLKDWLPPIIVVEGCDRTEAWRMLIRELNRAN